ncbi:MAG TPA: sugar ABC transporter permease [Candidatus Wallbacteria bacterium]|nr:sugar ABC transporter permease [Candidatus Wallbacteria bacterium]HPG57374.1 sugar ABC transporter permease [Candidatus Wallbacteria bacterium]
MVISVHSGGMTNYFKNFVGLSNFEYVITNKHFWYSMWNTLYYVVGTVPVQIFLSLFIAILLNQKIKGLEMYRVIYFLPVITSVNAISIVWKYMYQKYGVLNSFIGFLTGIPGPDWLMDTTWAMPAIIIMSVWKGLGYNVIIFLAGLQNVPPSLYDAAKIDGAGRWKTFWNVTWPMISPTTFFVMIMSTISSFQVFAQVYMMTGGGPQESTTVVIYYLYQLAYVEHKMGRASALAFILFLIIFAITYLQKKFTAKRVHYN